MSQVKVKYKVQLRGPLPQNCFDPGHVAMQPKDEADRLVRAGFAEYAKDDEPKTRKE